MEKPQSAASKTDFLAERIKQNESNQSLNLNEWAFGNIEGTDENINILELCCGTGRQTAQLATKFPNANITFIDLSEDAVNAVKEADFFEESRMKGFAIGLDEFFKANSEGFDLIFVSYGLYYATDMDYVINSAINSLNTKGRFIVLGPYGLNNKTLFDLVINSGVKIDDFVTYSCTDFMHDKVIRHSLNNFESYTIDTAINRVPWKKTEDLVSYWKNTTFYDSNCEAKFTADLDAHISANGEFPIEKHIMLFQAKNKL